MKLYSKLNIIALLLVNGKNFHSVSLVWKSQFDFSNIITL